MKTGRYGEIWRIRERGGQFERETDEKRGEGMGARMKYRLNKMWMQCLRQDVREAQGTG